MTRQPPDRVRPSAGHSRATGFTLLEMIVAMAVIASAMVVVVQAMSRVQDTWAATDAKVREAMDARAGIETLTRTVPRAVLNPRWAVDRKNESAGLLRDSDLHFVCGPVTDLFSSTGSMTGHAVFFQAPNGHSAEDDRASSSSSVKAEYDTLPNVLNAWGYFVEFGDDPSPVPAFFTDSRLNRPQAPKRKRFRLMEFRQPAHELELFAMTALGDATVPVLSMATGQHELYQWFDKPLQESNAGGKRRCAVIAENILALIILPLRPAQADDSSAQALTGGGLVAEEYLYDSRRYQWGLGSALSAESMHRLPPAIQVSLIVLDERDWSKLTDEEAFETGIALRGQVNPRFSKPENFNADMGSLTGELNRRRLKHRVVTTTLQLPAGLGAAGQEAGQP